MHHPIRKTPIYVVMTARIAAMITALLGIAVIVGWYLHMPALVQIYGSMAPMQLNAALCFLLSGLAIGSACYDKYKPALALGIITFVTAYLTLTQYLLGVNLGIDEIFLEHYIFTDTSHPGRMSPLTSVVFCLAGTSIILVSLTTRPKSCTFICGLFGAIVLALGAMAVFGYITGLSGSEGWGRFTQMAMHTGSGAMFIGLGLMALAWRIEYASTGTTPRWLSVAATLSAATATVILWNSLSLREEREIVRTVSANAEIVRNEIFSRLESRLLALERMARRWEYSPQIYKEVWEDDALYYIKDFPGYYEISWADPETRMKWVSPNSQNSETQTQVLNVSGREQMAFDDALKSDKSKFSRAIRLGNGELGMILPVPIYKDGEFKGFIVGTFELKILLDSILTPNIAAGYSVAIKEGRSELYRREGYTDKTLGTYGTKLEIAVHGLLWNLEVEPDDESLSSLGTPYPEAVMVFGILSSGLLGLSIHLARSATARSYQVTTANLKLIEEVSERRRAEQALQEVTELQRGIVTHAAYSVISTNPKGIITSFNPAAEKMLGYRADEVINKMSLAAFHDPIEMEQRAAALSKELGDEIKPGFDVFVARSRRGVAEQSEWIYIRKDSARIPVNLAITTLRNNSGEITGYIGIAGDISELKHAVSDLEATHSKLVEASRRAGMAEVATNVIHDIGNVLNSVNTSCSVVLTKVRESRIGTISKTAKLLDENSTDFATFFQEDPRGQKLPGFLEKVSAQLYKEREEVLTEISLLSKNIDHIRDTISMQQNYAMMSGVQEHFAIVDLIEDSLMMNGDSFVRHRVEIVKHYQEVPLVDVEKHKVLQILINLIGNARQACEHSTNDPKCVTINVRHSGDFVITDIIDNGIGIPRENMTRIFAHGFTTKKEGHGFGLHGSSLAAKQMGGNLTVMSEGTGKGSTFSLSLPVIKDQNPETKGI